MMAILAASKSLAHRSLLHLRIFLHGDHGNALIVHVQYRLSGQK